MGTFREIGQAGPPTSSAPLWSSPSAAVFALSATDLRVAIAAHYKIKLFMGYAKEISLTDEEQEFIKEMKSIFAQLVASYSAAMSAQQTMALQTELQRPKPL